MDKYILYSDTKLLLYIKIF